MLHDHFEVPLNAVDDTDLRQYIQDSIDVGELAALLNQEFQIELKLIDFKNIYTFQELEGLLQAALKES